jgi:mannose-binding lectin 2
MKFLIITLLSLVQTQTLHDYCLEAPFLDSGINSKEWNFGGDAFMNVDKFVRLTSNQKSQFGWLWSRNPLTTTISKDWKIEVEFKVGMHDGLAGDGFAVWLTEEKEKTGTAYGGAETFKGLGCFFDTYANVKHSVRFFS